MHPNEFTAASPGQLVPVSRDSVAVAFLPNPLPPVLTWTGELVAALSAADRAVGELAGAGRNLPNPHLLISPFTRNEAVVSSLIEGTRTSLGELLLSESGSAAAEAGSRQDSDNREVANYVEALNAGITAIRDRPVDATMVRQLHQTLMQGVRGGDNNPGAWRTRQVAIAEPGVTSLRDARFVPPPPERLTECLGALFDFMRAPPPLPPLVRIALVHYQFETIHPFHDGNGRVGRMLISLMLCAEGLLPGPLLYLSAFFERHRREYYDGLREVSRSGAWDGWLRYFLQGVRTQAIDAVRRAKRLMDLRDRYLRTCRGPGWSKKTPELLDALFRFPAVTAMMAGELLKATDPTVQTLIRKLVAAGILQEHTGRSRRRAYLATEIIRRIEEPLPMEDLEEAGR